MRTSRITEVKNQPEIAKINRLTGEIFVSSDIWHQLEDSEREYVLLHEQGHLVLQTPDEYAANAYAIKNFAPIGELNNSELGKKIMVMQSILDKADDNFSSFSGIGEAVNSVFQNLSVLGIGSKARAREAAANAAIIQQQQQAAAASTKATTKALLIAGAMILVLTVIILTLKK